ncbi:MAG: 4Fe-4S dicluster domain-containing protein [Treponema sp.]|jgi:MinD superfamily P-loop ATPase|nr:4Fe-4S dicluster domain-containing protein [Treponema sp.]
MLHFFHRLLQKPGIIKNDTRTCIYCGKCQKTCHHKAINVDKKNKAWVIDHEKCHCCGHCIKKCPIHALMLEINIP